MDDSHLDNQITDSSKKQAIKASLLLGTLGVVFGDIGTSPLYALRECFSGTHSIPIVRENILGSVSLIFWFLVLIVCVKYVAILMKADNKGEGGIMALMALIDRISPSAKKFGMLISLCGIGGAALLLSDAILTPVVTVLSALEGLTVTTAGFKPYILPVAIGILISLFIIQSKGTSKVGMLFGPIILVWFITIGILGFLSIIRHPDILHALNPLHAVNMLVSNHRQALTIIGTAFLSVTGAEVLYADMGHFGRKPIKWTWFLVVFPALVMSYFGQGAFLLSGSTTADNLFFRIVPQWLVLPLVILASLASSIASQAVITGIFSIVRQAVQLGFWPRLRVIHTSAHTIGQVFIPSANWLLCISTIALTLIFKESGKLASAYGIAVSTTMLLTTLMAIFIARQVWKAPRFVILIVWIFFILLNLGIFAANMSKFLSGGWMVVLFAAIISILMYTWVRGRKMLARKFASETVPLTLFSQDLVNINPIRVNGIAVFLSANVGGTPRSLLHNYKHNKVIHDKTLILNIQNQDVPTIPPAERATVTDLGNGLISILLKYGFMETPNVPKILAKTPIPGVQFDNMNVTYFLGKERFIISKKKSMYRWQKIIFRYLAHNSLDATTFFNIPSNRVVELGMQIEL